MPHVTFEENAKSLQSKLSETLSDLNLQRKQTEELRELLKVNDEDLCESSSDSWKLKYQVLNERKQELQHENSELRRQLAGLTPDRFSSKLKSPYLHCTSCVCLKKQKARQVRFFENLLLESRKQASFYQTECAKLKDQVKELQTNIASIQSKYEELSQKKSESLMMYKLRANRLEKRNAFELKGYSSEIAQIKSKLKEVDRSLVKVQLHAVSSGVKKNVLDDLSKITAQSLSLMDKLRILNTN